MQARRIVAHRGEDRVVPGIEIRICAEGALPQEEAGELAHLGLSSHVDHVVIRGTLVDQAALMGVLARLHRAGLRIQDVTSAGAAFPAAHVAHLVLAGQVAEFVRSALPDAVVTEHPPTTTAEVDIAGEDDLFDLLDRLESLGLELRAVHLGRPDHGGPLPV
jgi:hypothetical protein